jgi:hypothetical protein
MRETRSSGSVRGASGDGRPYRERSAEARDPADGLPLTAQEWSFVLGPSDGKLCPLPAIGDRGHNT